MILHNYDDTVGPNLANETMKCRCRANTEQSVIRGDSVGGKGGKDVGSVDKEADKQSSGGSGLAGVALGSGVCFYSHYPYIEQFNNLTIFDICKGAKWKSCLV